MNRAGLVDEVAEVLGDRRTAAAAVDAVLFAVQRAVQAGESVALTGFGVFERVDRPARTARNPATGRPVQVAAGAVPRFRAGTAFREIVSGARALPPEPSRVAAATSGAGRATTVPPSAGAPDATTTRARQAGPASSRGRGPAPAQITGEAGEKAGAPGKGKGKGKGKSQGEGKGTAGRNAGASGKAKGKAGRKAAPTEGRAGRKAPAKGGLSKKAGKRSGSTTGAKASQAGKR